MRDFFASTSRGYALAAAVGVWLAASLTMCAFPLTWVPGFTHALALNVLMGTVGLCIAVLLARRMARNAPESGPTRILVPAAASTAVLALLTVVSFLLALANGLRVGLCEVASSLSFYAVLPLASAPLVSVLGALLAASTRRRGAAAAMATGVVTATLVVTVWPILTGPQVFAFNHLLGHIPGPIYDERAGIDAAVLGWRALTLAWTGLLLGVGSLLTRGDMSLRAAVVLVFVSITAVAVLQSKRSDLGFHQNHETIADALGGVTKTDHFIIHYPKERDQEWVSRTERDHEYQYHVLRDWLELEPGEGTPVRSYVFGSAAEKGRLTGAGRTSMAKPWLNEMYLHDGRYPHRILRHELAHVLAGSFGTFPFRASGSSPITVNMGLVEGLAVAADWPADELSVHGWARAMRAVGAAPSIRSLFSASGFLSQSSSRAYTLAGSFVRWLVDTHGIDAVKDAYRSGCLSVIGEPDDLFVEWEAFLDSQPVGEHIQRLAEHRFRRPSILRRPCALDVTAARDRARKALREERFSEARRWFLRAAALEPNDPWHLKGLLDVFMAASKYQEAKDVALELVDHENADARLEAEATMALGDVYWRGGDEKSAKTLYLKVKEAKATEPLTRLAAAKAIATGDAFLAKELKPLLLGDTRRDLSLLLLRETLDERPGDALVRYLFGRRLFNARAYDLAAEQLSLADELGLPYEGGLLIESRRLLARSLYEAEEHPDRTVEAWKSIAGDPNAGEGARIDALDWVRRTRFSSEFENRKGIP